MSWPEVGASARAMMIANCCAAAASIQQYDDAGALMLNEREELDGLSFLPKPGRDLILRLKPRPRTARAKTQRCWPLHDGLA